MNEQEIIEQYRKQLESSKDEAPEGLWNDIANSLDIDEVWDNIAAELDSEKRTRSIWINISWAASILLILGLGISGLWLINKKSTTLNQTATLSPSANATTNNSKIQSQSIISDNTQSPSNPNKKDRLNGNQNIRIISNVTNSKSTENTNSDKQEETERINKLRPINAKDLDNNISPDKHIIIAQAKVESDDINQVENNKKLSVGITTAIKNTWLYGNETFNAFNRNSLTKPEVNIYPDFGLDIMYELSKKWRTEASIFFKSKTGQSYQEYLYGRYSNKNISLYYTQIEVSAKYVGKERWIKSSYFNFTSTIGLYFSNLNSASETIAGERKSVNYRYHNNDYGIVIGNGIDLLLSNRITLSSGYRIKWGISNIYAGDSNIPSSLNKTRNSSIELRFTLYYNILR
ncbi:MAG: PorT family protein [Bacteroidales bacterium]|nr:MAG: PorT family protein [Bacteroidales bacterium]